jgi:hypothetical protein
MCLWEVAWLTSMSNVGSMEDAWRVFNKPPSRNVVSWTAMILGHVKCGQGQNALDLFWQIQQECVQPDTVTFVGVQNACASVVALEEGRHAHEQIIWSGCESDFFVGAWRMLAELSRRCPRMMWLPGMQWFLDMWNVERGKRHWNSFDKCNWKVCICHVTFVGVLNASASLAALEEGRHAHEQITESCCE